MYTTNEENAMQQNRGNYKGTVNKYSANKFWWKRQKFVIDIIFVVIKFFDRKIKMNILLVINFILFTRNIER